MLAHQGRGYFGTTFARVWDVFSPSSPSFFWKSHGEVISWQFWTNTRRTRRSADGVFQLDSTSSASKCRRRPARAVPLPPPAPPPPPPPARSGHIFFRVELLIPVLRTRTAGCQILNLRAGSGWSCARRRREVGSIRSQRGSGAAGCCRLNAVGGTSQLLFLIPRDFPTFKSYICAPPPTPPQKNNLKVLRATPFIHPPASTIQELLIWSLPPFNFSFYVRLMLDPGNGGVLSATFQQSPAFADDRAHLLSPDLMPPPWPSALSLDVKTDRHLWISWLQKPSSREHFNKEELLSGSLKGTQLWSLVSWSLDRNWNIQLFSVWIKNIIRD